MAAVVVAPHPAPFHSRIAPLSCPKLFNLHSIVLNPNAEAFRPQQQQQEEEEDHQDAPKPPSSCIKRSPIEAAPESRPGLLSPTIIAREHSSRSIVIMGLENHLRTLEMGKLRSQLEQWGSVRHISIEEGGAVVAHFFDIRQASQALEDIQRHHLLLQHKFVLGRKKERLLSALNLMITPEQGLKRELHQVRASIRALNLKLKQEKGIRSTTPLWAQFFPHCCSLKSGIDLSNQGTIVVFNLNSNMPLSTIKSLFQKHGDVREIRETPVKKGHKFIEFFDVRHAAAALESLNGTELEGHTLKIEFSRPGGCRYEHTHQHHQLELFQTIAAPSELNPPAIPWEFLYSYPHASWSFGYDYGWPAYFATYLLQQQNEAQAPVPDALPVEAPVFEASPKVESPAAAPATPPADEYSFREENEELIAAKR